MILNKKIKDIIFLCAVLFFTVFLYILFSRTEGFTPEKREDLNPPKFNKTIWLFWLQGWDSTTLPWLQKQVAKSWEINNPSWKVEYLCLDNLKDYVTDIEYIYRPEMTPQAISDVVRLSLLKNLGGVWADTTCLCMQPLDGWLDEIIDKHEMWMYHGGGAGMSNDVGPCSWFIVSKKNSYMLTKWKEKCDEYWQTGEEDRMEHDTWMDNLFKDLFENDDQFRETWNKVPKIDADAEGQSHCMESENNNDLMTKDDSNLKDLLLHKPPYVIKLWNSFNALYFPDPTTEECRNSVSYYAIQMSKRRFNYKHNV